MKSVFRFLLFAVAFLFSGAAFSAAQLGTDYSMLATPQPVGTKKIEVMEFFFYECPHCYHLHNELMGWEKTLPGDVEMVFVPTIFRDSTEPLARAYYALEAMGKSKQLEDPIYQAIHVKNMDLHDLNSISAFVASQGVDKAKFIAAYNSFTVNSEITRAKQMIRSYGINGTPTLIVDGRYVITGLQPAATLRALDDVIAMVRKERSAKH
jgi:protein dithiol oxidoreductase (disulfide-forming)